MKKLFYIAVLCFIPLFVACTDDSPEGLLSKSDMEAILYDMHISQCMSSGMSQRMDDMNKLTYRRAVLKKYGVTIAEWDSSYNYYCRHADELYDIYQAINERMQNELLAMGGDVSLLSGNIAEADTSNLWKQESQFIMMHLVPYNVRTFSLQADSSYHAGDKISLTYDAQFVFQDGARDFVTVLALTLGNDSVVSQVMHCSSDGHQSVTVSDEKRLGIKSVQGYMFISQGMEDKPLSSLRLLSVRNVRLIRMHTDSKSYEERLRQDSIRQARTDSARNAEIEQMEKEQEQTNENTNDQTDGPTNTSTNNEKTPITPPKRMLVPLRTR